MLSGGKKSEKGEVIIGVIAAIFVNDVLHFSRGQVVHTPFNWIMYVNKD